MRPSFYSVENVELFGIKKLNIVPLELSQISLKASIKQAFEKSVKFLLTEYCRIPTKTAKTRQINIEYSPRITNATKYNPSLKIGLGISINTSKE